MESPLYPLHAACRNREPASVIQQLLNDYPDAVRQPDSDGLYPLHCACWYHTSDDVILLLLNEYPQAVTERSTSDGFVPLNYALINPNLIDSTTVIQRLVEIEPSFDLYTWSLLMTYDDLFRIINVLLTTTSLKELKIAPNRLESQDAMIRLGELFRDILPQNRSLERLILYGPMTWKLSTEFVQAFSIGLQNNVGLVELMIGIASITGVTTLFGALRMNQTLRKLNIGCREMSNAGLIEIFDALKHNVSLYELKILVVEGELNVRFADVNEVQFINEDIDTPYHYPGVTPFLLEAETTPTILSLLDYNDTLKKFKLHHGRSDNDELTRLDEIEAVIHQPGRLAPKSPAGRRHQAFFWLLYNL